MKLVIDMETRSRVDLKKCGVYVYAEDESTDVLCIAVKEDNFTPKLWVDDLVHYATENLTIFFERIYAGELNQLIKKADEIHAHNVQFERVMWTQVMVGRYNYSEIPFHKWRDTAAKAAVFALPRNLDGACKALKLPRQKDMAGHRIMMKMCKPNNRGVWQEDPDDFIKLCEYCIDDVEAEYALDKALPDLTVSELEIWRMDQLINDRGIYVDIEAIDNLMYKIEEKGKKLLEEVKDITDGKLNSTSQRDAMLVWLKENGLELPDLTKDTVTEALKNIDATIATCKNTVDVMWEVDVRVRRLLEIRQSLAKTSVSKLQAMKRMACKDNRVRGTIIYYGANTGRFSGKGIQPHNYPRNAHSPETIDKILYSGLKGAEELTHSCIIQETSKCLRGMLTAAPGYDLICGDFKSIEAVILAWVAGEKSVLQAFRDGLDLYKVAAMDVYKGSYEDVTEKERFVGKTIVLACGYQGWIAAYRAIANEEINKMDDDEISEIIGRWRNARVATVRFWRGIESAASETVRTGKVHSYRGIKFGIRNNFLHCRLPSNRLLSYYDPKLADIITKYDQEKRVVSFLGITSMSKKWERQFTYGGKFTENIVQALARDVLVEAMQRLERAGFKRIVLHVHDEIVAEISKVKDANAGRIIQAGFEIIMSKIPEWAEGCPIGVESWIGKRYRKG